MMWWAIWCAAIVAGAVAAPASDALAHLSALDLPQMESLTPDDERLGYAAVPASARFAAAEPWLYLLADMPRDSQEWSGRGKRRMPSLSIDLPMAVLREKLTLEKSRKDHALRAAANRNFLNDIGKRESVSEWRTPCATEAQNAIALHQQPHGSAAPAADAGGGPQADARGQPAASRRQPRLPTERWQTRFLGELWCSSLRQLE